MPRPEGLAFIPRQYLTPRDSASPAESHTHVSTPPRSEITPQQDPEKVRREKEAEEKKAAYEARLAALHSPLLTAFASNPEMERAIREAIAIVQDTAEPGFRDEHKDDYMKARGAVWTAFMDANEVRAAALMAPRKELKEGKSIWFAVRDEVEKAANVPRPPSAQPLRKPRRT